MRFEVTAIESLNQSDTPDIGQVLAEFSVNTAVKQFPSVVVKAIKRLFMDTVGVMLGARSMAHARQAASVAQLLSGAPQASIVGTAVRVAMTEAAFANGVAAHGIDFDDTHRFVHPGCVVVPVVLALGEQRRISGADFIAALVSGYEISIRVAFAAGKAHRVRGFHPTGTCNVFGAAAAASRVLGLDVAQTRAALGVASSMPAGLTRYRFNGAANKHLHAGLAARNGILAALLAAEGFDAVDQALEGTQGFLEVYADLAHVDLLTDGLGTRYYLVDTDIKPYPSCRQSHTAIDLALELRQRHGLQVEAIERIKIAIYTYADRDWYTDNRPPATALEAMLRIPYCVACALVFGEVGLRQFDADVLASSTVHSVLPRIAVSGDPALDATWPQERGIRMHCLTRDGRQIKLAVSNPRGGSEKPLSDEEIYRKFARLAESYLSPAAADQFKKRVENLENLAHLGELIELLTDHSP